jgi:hypothetical protein
MKKQLYKLYFDMDDKPVHNWSVSAEMLPKNEKTEEIYRQRAIIEAAEAEKAA